MTVGGLAEDLELAVMAMDSAARKEYAEIILPSVRAGRAKLVLRDPIEARALAFFKQVLLSIEDPV
jgi:predicted metal-dependent HD superfamily phosphohydrolase